MTGEAPITGCIGVEGGIQNGQNAAVVNSTAVATHACPVRIIVIHAIAPTAGAISSDKIAIECEDSQVENPAAVLSGHADRRGEAAIGSAAVFDGQAINFRLNVGV